MRPFGFCIILVPFNFVRPKLTQSGFRLLHPAEEAEVTVSGEAGQDFSPGQDDGVPAQTQQLQHLRPRYDRVQAGGAGIPSVPGYKMIIPMRDLETPLGKSC